MTTKTYIQIILEDYDEYISKNSDIFLLNGNSYSEEFLEKAYYEGLQLLDLFSNCTFPEFVTVYNKFYYLVEKISDKLNELEQPSEPIVDYLDMPEQEFNFNY